MKNKEKYAEQLLNIFLFGLTFGVNADGKPRVYQVMHCDECLFNDSNIIKKCGFKRREWAESEYVERPVISKRDRAVLSYLNVKLKYIARDKLGKLWAFECIPRKVDVWWGESSGSFDKLGCLDIRFPMIKWEDEEPWLIEDLKKLEVVEEY